MTTLDETAEVMGILMASLRLVRPVADTKVLLNAWHMALSDLCYADVQLAAMRVVQEDTYFPEPSRLRIMVLQATMGLPDIDQAWTIINDALHSHGRERWQALPAPARNALSDAVDALGGLYTLRNSERPERDRDQFYRLWPEIRTRYLRGEGMLPTVEIGKASWVPDGYLAVESGGKVIGMVQAVVEDTGILTDADYATMKPKPVPRSILHAPPGPSESGESS